MIGKTPWLLCVIGALLGLFLIHPLLMITAQMMNQDAANLQSQVGEFSIQRAFSLGMLPWALGFAGLSGLVAWLLAKMRLSLIYEKKLQGAMELAGAACHQLNQPMQVVLGYAEILRQEAPREDPLGGYLEKVIAQIAHMDKILKKIRAITRYETFEYLKGIQLIDIDKASGEE